MFTAFYFFLQNGRGGGHKCLSTEDQCFKKTVQNHRLFTFQEIFYVYNVINCRSLTYE